MNPIKISYFYIAIHISTINFFNLFKGFKIIPDFIKPSFISLAVLTALLPSPCTQIESISQGICFPE